MPARFAEEEDPIKSKKYFVGGLYFLIFCVSLFFGFGGTIFDRLDEIIFRFVPDHTATAALILFLILIPVIESMPSKLKYLKMSLWALFALSVLVLPAAKRLHPIISWYAGVLFFAELTLFLPWWRARTNRVGNSADSQ